MTRPLSHFSCGTSAVVCAELSVSERFSNPELRLTVRTDHQVAYLYDFMMHSRYLGSLIDANDITSMFRKKLEKRWFLAIHGHFGIIIITVQYVCFVCLKTEPDQCSALHLFSKSQIHNCAVQIHCCHLRLLTQCVSGCSDFLSRKSKF